MSNSRIDRVKQVGVDLLIMGDVDIGPQAVDI